MVSIGRNSPCPCGSGKRYKDCHGDLRTDSSTAIVATLGAGANDRLEQAASRLRSGDIDGAESLARESLEASPDHPEALQILGRCHFERGEPEEGLRSLLRAVKSMRSIPLGPSVQYAIWTDLNFMFTQALSGLDSTFAVAKRADYTQWLSALKDRQGRAAPLVSVVLLVLGPARWLRAALDSIYAQNYRNIELIVVHEARDAPLPSQIADLLAICPFRYELLPIPDATEPAMINAGVRASTGEFLNVLHVNHKFAASRIATLVDQIANRGVAWGFAGVDFIGGEDQPLDSAGDPRIRRWVELLRGIDEPDTVGHALIHQECVAVAAGNLFFSRPLFDKLGGFRELPHTFAWDFALRAVWYEEPVHVPTAEYQHRVVSSGESVEPPPAAFEAAQLAMFTEFYATACREEAVPPNPYAPCVHNWRMHFLKTPFHTGHILMFPLDHLEHIADVIMQRRSLQRAAELAPGLNLVGFAFGEFGLGESLRAFASACVAGSIPFVVNDVDMRLKARQADRSIAPYIADELRHRCSLYCLNPDMMKPVRRLIETAAAAGGYGVGYWYWELERLPREWDQALAIIDEIWVATEFVAGAVRAASPKPVIKIPPPIEVILSRPYRRAEFGLPDDRFLFLFSFDFNSFIKRKNPEGAIAAFKQAFGNARGDVGLVIKSINGSNRPDKLREMRDLVDGDDRIIFIDSFYSRDQVSGLQSVVDAFVSLHRAEGFGLGLAESMYQGKPVIGTAYSGNLEFMDHDNSCLVDYELVPVSPGEYLYHDERFRWAEPDVAQAAHHLRRLVDDADFRKRIAARGQDDIRARFTRTNAALMMRERLTELGLL